MASADSQCSSCIDPLHLVPQYLDQTHTFSLDRFDCCLQFMLQYIAYCGLHGACWKQITAAVQRIVSHQRPSHSAAPCVHHNAASHSLSSCNLPHFPLHSKPAQQGHGHQSHSQRTIYSFLLRHFVAFLQSTVQRPAEHDAVPFEFYVIDRSVDRTGNGVLTLNGVEWPCTVNREAITIDDFLSRFHAFEQRQNGAQCADCFICDIFIVRSLSARRRCLGMADAITPIPDNKTHSTPSTAAALRFCVLELIGRTGTKGMTQSEVLSAVKTMGADSKGLSTAIKRLVLLGLIQDDVAVSAPRGRRLWLSAFGRRCGAESAGSNGLESECEAMKVSVFMAECRRKGVV